VLLSNNAVRTRRYRGAREDPRTFSGADGVHWDRTGRDMLDDLELDWTLAEDIFTADGITVHCGVVLLRYVDLAIDVDR